MPRDRQALVYFLAERLVVDFHWGNRRNDCVSFAARAVEAQTGINPLGDLSWDTLPDAEALLDELGGLEAAVDARLTRIPASMATRGDIGAVPDKRFGISLMVVEGATLVGPGRRGLKRLPRPAMIAAWSAETPDG